MDGSLVGTQGDEAFLEYLKSLCRLLVQSKSEIFLVLMSGCVRETSQVPQQTLEKPNLHVNRREC